MSNSSSLPSSHLLRIASNQKSGPCTTTMEESTLRYRLISPTMAYLTLPHHRIHLNTMVCQRGNIATSWKPVSLSFPQPLYRKLTGHMRSPRRSISLIAYQLQCSHFNLHFRSCLVLLPIMTSFECLVHCASHGVDHIIITNWRTDLYRVSFWVTHKPRVLFIVFMLIPVGFTHLDMFSLLKIAFLSQI